MHCKHYSQRKLVQGHIYKYTSVGHIERLARKYESQRGDGKPETSWRSVVRWELGRHRREKA